MDINLLSISNYLENLLDVRPELHRIHPDEIGNVALHLRHSYSYYRTLLAEREVVFALPNTDSKKNPGRIALNIKALSHALRVPVILVLESITGQQLRGFINRRVPFLVPGKQIFIPQLFIDIKPKLTNDKKTLKYFSPATQTMLIHHLYVHTLNGMNQSSIAPIIHYSAMTVSRSVRELEQAQVLTFNQYGVQFIANKQELWNKSLPYLRSPVRETIFADKVSNEPKFIMAGLTALEQYADITGISQTSYAIPSESLKSLRDKPIFNMNHTDGDIAIELWRYDPKVLTQTSYVDPFSLYLSLRDQNHDERTQAAIDSLLHEYL